MNPHIPLSLRAATLSLAFAIPFIPARAQEKKPVTVEAIYAGRPIGCCAPSGLVWSPDGTHLTYVENSDLMELDLDTAQAKVLVSHTKLATLQGDATTEKDADHRARYGMAGYLWAPDSKHLLFDLNGRLWYFDLKTGTGLNIGSSGAASGDDPKFSPDGKSLSFLKDKGTEHGLSVIHLHDEATRTFPVAVTNNPDVLNGKVDWVYEEELDVRSNYFWSPDSSHLVYLQMDETHVPTYPITDFIPTHPTVDQQRYPQPGDPNPAVRVGVAGLNGGKTTWMKLPADAFKPGEDYIPRFGWVDAHTVWIETLARDQKHKNLYFADSSNGNAKLVLEQTDPKFIDLKYDVAVQDGHIVFTSWEDGHTHIYLYSYDPKSPLGGQAKLVRQLTKGDYDVASIHGIDEKRKLIFYSSNEGDPQNQQVWQVDFEGQHKAVTPEAGHHSANFAPQGGYYTDSFSTRTTPPTQSLCKVDGTCHQFWSTHDYDAFRLHPEESLEVKAKDGTTLYATIMLPEGKHDPASVPLILNPYGGPGAQGVTNSWPGAGFDQVLVEHGFAVLHADNRGSEGRGRDFAQACYHNFGPIQFEDQLAVADAALAKYPQLDAKRQGWWGWSWGGTFTLWAMTHSNRFRAGVSVAPVTDWHNYDSIYTERYMSEPKDFPEGYKEQSVISSADKLHGHLLMVHGTGDDNVHMQNTIQFVQQLTVNNKPYDLQLYPRKTHSIAGPEVRPHLFNRILQQFETYLAPPVTENEK